MSESRKRIFIIEDNPIHRLLMVNEFQQDYELETAADSEQALARLASTQSAPFDLVIVDTRLPANLGEQEKDEESQKVLEVLEKHYQHQKVVVVASNSIVPTTQKLIERMGIRDNVYRKPFLITELHERINYLMGVNPIGT